VTRRAKVWRVIAALFTVINVGGAGIAILSGEPLHAALHVALLIATYVVWRLVSRRHQRELPDAQPVDERLEHLQQSLDAIALDVERIGEAQRYAMKVVSERARSSPPKPSQ
jgi:hypothetical protein